MGSVQSKQSTVYTTMNQLLRILLISIIRRKTFSCPQLCSKLPSATQMMIGINLLKLKILSQLLMMVEAYFQSISKSLDKTFNMESTLILLRKSATSQALILSINMTAKMLFGSVCRGQVYQLV